MVLLVPQRVNNNGLERVNKLTLVRSGEGSAVGHTAQVTRASLARYDWRQQQNHCPLLEVALSHWPEAGYSARTADKSGKERTFIISFSALVCNAMQPPSVAAS